VQWKVKALSELQSMLPAVPGSSSGVVEGQGSSSGMVEGRGGNSDAMEGQVGSSGVVESGVVALARCQPWRRRTKRRRW
jgi:hypothetical protein